MSSADDTAVEKANWHWRNSMRTIRFFHLDARAVLPFCVLLFYFRPITVFITCVFVVFFAFLERRGLTFPAALRAFRVWLLGPDRPAWLPYRHRRMKDFG